MCQRHDEPRASAFDNVEMEKRLNSLLRGEAIQQVALHDRHHLAIFFKSGARLFVDASTDLELSIT